MPTPSDFQWARQRRAVVKASGGVLDIMLPMRVGGSGYPLFCAHPVVGLSWCYLGLFQHVGAEHAVYGLQSRGLRRPEPLPATMPEMAREFADRIRITQPDGPYHLLGWSLGGNIAHAVAEELERRGLEIGLLAVLDTLPLLPDALSAEADGAWLLYDFVLAEFGYDPALVEGEPEPEAKVLEVIRDRPGLGLGDWSDDRVLALLRVIRNNVLVTRAYQPGRVRCGLTFFSATQNLPALPAKLDRWRPYVSGPIDVVELDCKHQHMLLPLPASRIGAELTSRMVAPRPVEIGV